jgi:hypothetical protein
MAEENHFLRFIEGFNKPGSSQPMRTLIADNPEFEKAATGAEVFDNLLVSKFYKLLQIAMLVRANESEIALLDESGVGDGPARRALETARAAALARYEPLCEQLENDIDYQVVPIKKLVTVQLACGLLAADYVRNRKL